MSPYEMLYGRKCRTPVCWDEVGSSELASTDVVLATTEKIETIRKRLKEAQDREVAYTLELPEEMRGIHNTFHASYLRKCLADESSVITLDEVEINLESTFQEEPITILGRKSRQFAQTKVNPVGAESPTNDAYNDGNENGSSSDSEGLNYGGFTEEMNALRSTINKQVGKAIKNVMPNDMATYRDFTICDVPKFDEALDLIANTRWLAAVEGVFRTSNCKEKNNVNFASNFLYDSAKMWWEGKVCEKGEEWI
ncbi:hypothetical protein Tco_0587793 [Tanacetum coccineum]